MIDVGAVPVGWQKKAQRQTECGVGAEADVVVTVEVTKAAALCSPAVNAIPPPTPYDKVATGFQRPR